MEIGIIGSGYVGSTLAGHLTALGHNVKIANSRGPESLAGVAEKTGATAVAVEQAASAKDIVIVAVPPTAMEKLPVQILSASQAIIIDAGNYYPSRDGENPELEGGLTDSEWTAKVLGHPVIKAFNNILSTSLASKSMPEGSPDRIAISVAGDQDEHKEIVQALINKMGFDAIDGGPLSESWRQQPGTPAYCRDLGKESLAAALEEADPGKRTQYLEMADEAIRPFL
ncbi:NADP oxidoreductase [Chryseobacterium sp. Leaf404]|uniref:NADPH-dependent F420 reductase n=1 Tax=unclassified Chryseobacterium TaxID=2593645 RepID=UPI0006FF7258|nr:MULTISPECIES: NAD(P)-binding domain-containing protein [unclassified Chryseobacterium]KQT20848.1 NADP oxidoreductase [Chryseobacterium sp. Leaf404]